MIAFGICPVCTEQIEVLARKDFESFTGEEVITHIKAKHPETVDDFGVPYFRIEIGRALSTEAREIIAEVTADAEANSETPCDQWDNAQADYLRDYQNSWACHGLESRAAEQATATLVNEINNYFRGA
jgi:hypothetical protein